MAAVLGATLVDGDLLWHIVQVDGTFQQSPGSSHIALGSQQEAHRIASAVNGPLQIFLFTSHIALGFIHPPTLANGVLAPTKYGGRHRHHLDSPSMHCGVVDGNTAFPHHLFNVTQAQRIGHVPSHARQHHFQRVVQPFENFASSAIDQTFTEIMHALNCRFCLLRQNLQNPKRRPAKCLLNRAKGGELGSCRAGAAAAHAGLIGGFVGTNSVFGSADGGWQRWQWQSKGLR